MDLFVSILQYCILLSYFKSSNVFELLLHPCQRLHITLLIIWFMYCDLRLLLPFLPSTVPSIMMFTNCGVPQYVAYPTYLSFTPECSKHYSSCRYFLNNFHFLPFNLQHLSTFLKSPEFSHDSALKITRSFFFKNAGSRCFIYHVFYSG